MLYYKPMVVDWSCQLSIDSGGRRSGFSSLIKFFKRWGIEVAGFIYRQLLNALGCDGRARGTMGDLNIVWYITVLCNWLAFIYNGSTLVNRALIYHLDGIASIAKPQSSQIAKPPPSDKQNQVYWSFRANCWKMYVLSLFHPAEQWL